MKTAIKWAALLVAVWPLRLHAAPEILPLGAERLNAVELQALEPFPDSVVLSGHSEHWEKVLHRGEVVVSIYAAKPALLRINIPFRYDEFVWMLGGELVLTPVEGQALTLGPGEAVLVPKGFMGTWEVRGNYRELIVIETDAVDRVSGE